ncbi:MAG: 30S ribosomal protein S3 [Armatimonadetes bacterium]|nr:30S ribosomal protein S3 [Armatimonadota bacterium]
MGQKVHPYGLRLGIIRQSRSTWFAEGKKYREQLIGDLKIRQFLEKELLNASVSNIAIERAADNISVTIETGKPGIVIGRGGRDVEKLRQKVEKVAGRRVRVNVEETKDPDTNAALVAQNIARQIERRVSYRRAMRQAIDRAIRMGAQGMRCTVSGRLQGAEIARTEALGPEGRVPLHTLRADVHFGFAEARTGYGNIGVKVWIYKGDILPPRKVKQSDMYVPEETAEAPVEDVVAEGAIEDVAPSVEAAFETPVEAETPAAPETAEAPTESVAPADEPATEPEPEQGQ